VRSFFSRESDVFSPSDGGRPMARYDDIIRIFFVVEITYIHMPCLSVSHTLWLRHRSYN